MRLKLTTILLFVTLYLLPLQAQLLLKDGVVTPLPNDTEILVNRRSSEQRQQITDDNNRLCALLKISTENMTEEDRNLFRNTRNRETDRATFVQKVETDHVNEIWFFLSPNPSYLILKHPDYGNCRIDFNAMGIELESGKVYAATIVGDRKVYESILARTARNMSSAEEDNQYLVITAQPNDATIYINGELAGVGEASKRLPKGMRHVWRVEAPMYLTEEGAVELDERVSLDVSLKENFGHISVSTMPEDGAIVYIDDEQVGTTPYMSDKRFSVGSHTIRVVKQQFATTEAVVNVEAGKRTPATIKMDALFSNVTIHTDSDVEIYVDEAFKGVGDWEGRLSEGLHLIEGRKAKHRSSRMEYRVELGKDATVQLASPEPIYGRLEVNGTPNNATVYLNNREIGLSPNIFSNILIGDYTLRVAKTGYITHTEKVTITENQTTMQNVNLIVRQDMPVTITTTPRYPDTWLTVDGERYFSSFSGTLNIGDHTVIISHGSGRYSERHNITVTANNTEFTLPFTGKLSIESTPEDSEIYVDGVYVGRTPYLLKRATGSYNIELKNSKTGKGLSAEKRVNIKEGEEMVLNLHLKRFPNYSFIEYVLPLSHCYNTPPLGLMYGYCSNWGLYVKGIYHHPYENYINVNNTEENFIGDRKKHIGENMLSISVGVMKRVCSWMYLSVGVGYGEFKNIYKVYYGGNDWDYNYYLPQSTIMVAPQAEVNAILKFRKFSLSAGYNATIPENIDHLTTDVHIGIGININHH